MERDSTPHLLTVAHRQTESPKVEGAEQYPVYRIGDPDTFYRKRGAQRHGHVGERCTNSV